MTAPKQPIPDAALDDRLGFVGTAGSGKSYNAMSRVERLLLKRARVCCVDPLGVFWGLRLNPDGKTASGFDIPIFGGQHGDLPLTEHSGALIGETVAGMADSCIIDLSEIGTKAGERRFMLAFLTALYRKSKDEPLHLVIDEADMFAPQKLTDKDGDAARLLGMMETVVRRGRIKGFIPWLITQRPAVIAKDVLSQVDGLVAFKLTSSQDRDALSAWVEGSADKEDWKVMRAALPAMERGQGVVWIPGRGVMETVSFPPKITFDSSRTPKRGEKRSTAELKPLDLGSLRERLAQVDADRKADDPKALRAEIATLRKELGAKSHITQSAESLALAEARGFERGKDAVAAEAVRVGQGAILSALTEVRQMLMPVIEGLDAGIKTARIAFPDVSKTVGDTVAPIRVTPVTGCIKPGDRVTEKGRPDRVIAQPRAGSSPKGPGLDAPLQRIVNAIRWWNVFGLSAPTPQQVGFLAGYSPTGGTWKRYLSSLRSMAMIEPRGDLLLTDAGRAAANDPTEPPSGPVLRDAVFQKIDAPLQRILRPIMLAYPHAADADEVGQESGYEPSGGTWKRYLSALRSLDLIERRGELKAQGWLFP